MISLFQNFTKSVSRFREDDILIEKLFDFVLKYKKKP